MSMLDLNDCNDPEHFVLLSKRDLVQRPRSAYGQCDVCSVRGATRKGIVCGTETYYCAICAGDTEEDDVVYQGRSI